MSATATTADGPRHPAPPRGISDHAWGNPGIDPARRPGQSGRSARNNRRFVNAVFRVPGAGALWRDLPPDYGDGCAAHRRFSRRSADGTWAKLLDAVSDEPDPDG